MNNPNFFTLKVVEDKIYNEHELINFITNYSHGTLEIEIEEGPDLSVIKLFGKSLIESLHMLAENLGIDKKNIKLITFNLIQDLSVWPNMEIQNPSECFTAADRYEVPLDKQIQKHFGVFVGTSRWHRLYIASMMYGLHKDKTMMSFWQHHLNNNMPANLWMDEVMLKDANRPLRDYMFEFTKKLPMHLNNEDIKINDNKGADISRGDWETAYEILPYYNNIFVDLVCETWHEGTCFLPNEKTSRPIISRTPFIAYAGKGFLANLKKIGFKTFDKWWSEGYDNHEGVSRIQHILREINTIANYPVDRLQEMHQEMMPTLQHNYETIKSLTPQAMLAKLQ